MTSRSPLAREPRVAVQLVTWNGSPYLAACLASLDRQTMTGWTLAVLDNHSTDATVATIRQWLAARPTAVGQIHVRPENIGFANGHNELLRAQDAPYTFILNQDVRLTPTYLGDLVSYLEARREVGSASGTLLRWERGPDGLVATDTVDSTGLTIYRTHRVVEREREQRWRCRSKPEEVFGAPATAILYRRRALDEAALRVDDRLEWFDGSFGSYKEDVDLAYRLQLVGWGSVYVPTAVAYHHRGLRGAADADRPFGTTETWRHHRQKSPAANAQSYRNHLLFLLQCFPFSVASWTGVATICYELVKLAAVALGEPRTLLHAWRDVFRRRGAIRQKRRQILGRRCQPQNIQRFLAV